ncbi:MAG TPA: glycogen synthase [Anaerolineae bacterium]|nr:glycogen synthase [Anaerolineae bacterium]
MTTSETLKILYLSAEVVPFAKTGGLADVAGSLPKAIGQLGHDIRVAMPRYGRVHIEHFGLTEVLPHLSVPMDEEQEDARIWQGHIGEDDQKVPVYFVDNARLYDRDGIYMYPDDAERFIFFSRAAVEMCKMLDWQPDIIHCNDWHTAIVPNWMKTIYKDDPFFAHTATVYTIHNLAYQGIFGYRVLEIAGIDEYGFIAHPDLAPDLQEVVDLMARGILFADVINTVSERYAREILIPEYGERLDPLLRDRRDRLFGILNGIDTDVFNPATDPHITVNYDVNSLDKRPANKAALQKEAKLPERPDVPLVGIISRLADQKGFDLISAVIDPLLRHVGCQFVLLGTGDQHYHELFEDVARRYPDQAAVFLTFNAPLAQRIYAGSDMFLMPSRFEPCGLGQMIAMRYGSVPVVRATGGLADTVQDYNPITGEGNGFSFEPYDAMALYTALVRAAETYKYRDVWRKLQMRGMMSDFSWAASARRYVDLYRRALAARTGNHSPDEYDLLHEGRQEQ